MTAGFIKRNSPGSAQVLPSFEVNVMEGANKKFFEGASYCFRCGYPMAAKGVGHRQTRPACTNEATDCNYIYWGTPETTVAVMVLLENQVVLIKRGTEPGVGLPAFPGGHVDAGEEPDTAAIREVFEETGLHIELIRLLAARNTPVNKIVLFYVARVKPNQEMVLRAGDDAEAVFLADPANLPEEFAFPDHREFIEKLLVRKGCDTKGGCSACKGGSCRKQK
jgi:8-oxo-dGTP diphosphatase